MPRPTKWRKVEFIPGHTYFVPFGKPKCQVEENILKIEELEAVRLKDIENLDQDQCAERMGVSRQTFQRILNEARGKIADALVQGKAIRIQGGNFTQNICNVRCLDCKHQWQESYENYEKMAEKEYECPKCGSQHTVCMEKGSGNFCYRHCWKKALKNYLTKEETEETP